MTYAFTDNVQIEEGWEIPMDLYTELGKIEDLFNKIHPYMLPMDFLTGGFYKWAEDIAIAGILEQQPHQQIVEAILDGYDPTPDVMPIGEMF